jgi:hypothetical protein
MNQRQKQTSLKYLLNEVTSKKRMHQRQFSNVMKYVSLSEQDVSKMLSSGFFTENEVKAINILFSTTKTTQLNENTMRRIDRSVKIISESKPNSRVLSEGLLGNIWSKLSKLGDRAKEIVVGGWAKIKAAWSEFKELIQEFVNDMSTMFGKAIDWASGMIKQELESYKDEMLTSWNATMSKLDDVNEKKQLGTDLSNAYDTGKWVVDSLKEKVTSTKAEWFQDTIAGKGNIDDTGIEKDPEDLETGFEELKNESVNTAIHEELLTERSELFGNSLVLKNLIEAHKRRLSEAGGAAHLEDAVSNPFLKKILKYGVKALQYALIPIAKLAQEFVQKKAAELLKSMSGAVKFLGGPGKFAFPVFALIIAEVIELVVKNFTADYSPAKLIGKAAEWLVPGLGPAIAFANGIWDAMKTFLFVWTIGNILFNLVLAARKAYTGSQGGESGAETGGEPEVQTAGYKPNGKFKLREGKLIFIS